MVVEPLVFGDYESLLHRERNLVEFNESPALVAELGDEAAVSGVEFRGLAGRVVVERLDRRTFAAATNQSPGAVSNAKS